MNASILAALVFIGLAAVILLIWSLRKPHWMGFKDKTLWDWISLLTIPAFIWLGTVVIGAIQQSLERGRIQEIAVQQFFTTISELTLDERVATAPEAGLAIGRAHTTSVLQLVDQDRAGRVLVFISELGVLQDYAVSFEGLDLRGAELKNLNLDNMNFEDSSLRNADLEGGSFRAADFEDADMRGSDLKDSDLRDASFEGARMKGTDLDRADLRGADLRLALGLKQGQVDNTCANAATRLPAGMMVTPEMIANCDGLADD